MSTQTDIINMALVALHVTPNAVVSPPSSPVVSAILIIYDNELEDLITKKYWRFSVKDATLVAATTPTFTQYPFAYTLPSDYLKALQTDPIGDYEIFSKTGTLGEIYAFQQTLRLIYQFKVAENALPPYFVKLFALAIAKRVAYQVTTNLQLFEVIKADYLQQLNEAGFVDAQSRTPNRLVIQSYIASRQI